MKKQKLNFGPLFECGACVNVQYLVAEATPQPPPLPQTRPQSATWLLPAPQSAQSPASLLAGPAPAPAPTSGPAFAHGSAYSPATGSGSPARSMASACQIWSRWKVANASAQMNLTKSKKIIEFWIRGCTIIENRLPNLGGDSGALWELRCRRPPLWEL